MALMLKREESYMREYMEKENEKYFCKLLLFKIPFKEKVKILFKSDGFPDNRIGRYLIFNMNCTPEVEGTEGMYFSKSKIKKLIKYLNNLLEFDDAIEKRKI